MSKAFAWIGAEAALTGGLPKHTRERARTHTCTSLCTHTHLSRSMPFVWLDTGRQG